MTKHGDGRTPEEVREYMKEYMRAVRKGTERPGRRNMQRVKAEEPAPVIESGNVRRAV